MALASYITWSIINIFPTFGLQVKRVLKLVYWLTSWCLSCISSPWPWLCPSELPWAFLHPKKACRVSELLLALLRLHAHSLANAAFHPKKSMLLCRMALWKGDVYLHRAQVRQDSFCMRRAIRFFLFLLSMQLNAWPTWTWNKPVKMSHLMLI